MSTATNDILILDIGSAWTKAFYLSSSEKEVKFAKAKLPSTAEDLRYSSTLLINKLKGTNKNPKIIITSTFSEADALAKPLSATFVNKEQTFKEIQEWFVTKNFENPIIFDGGASNFLRSFRVSDIGAYLSFPISETDLENFIGNKTFRVFSIPEDKYQLEIEEALLRNSFKSYPELHNPNKFNNLIITGGLFSYSTKPTRIALLLLDLMASGKVVQVLQDNSAFLNAYGALISQRKNFKSADVHFLENLGCLVSLGGTGKVSLDYGLSEVQEVSISQDEIALIPASEDQKVELTILSNPKQKFYVSGGEWGIILDGRTKPLSLEFGQEKSRVDMATWQQALDKVELIKI